MDEIAALTPTFAGVSFAKLDEVGSVQWPCNAAEAAGHADHARGHLRSRPRQVQRHAVRAHRGALEPSLPAAAHHRPHPQPVQRRRADPAHQQRRVASARTSSRSIRTTPRSVASRDGDEITLASRVGATTLHAMVSDRMPQGVVYTTFHHPVSGANVVTTEWSDWATNCPEYKVTAVQVTPGHSAATVELDHPEHRLSALVRMANQIARQFAHEPPEQGGGAGRPAPRTVLGARRRRADLAEAIECRHRHRRPDVVRPSSGSPSSSDLPREVLAVRSPGG